MFVTGACANQVTPPVNARMIMISTPTAIQSFRRRGADGDALSLLPHWLQKQAPGGLRMPQEHRVATPPGCVLVIVVSSFFCLVATTGYVTGVCHSRKQAA